MSSQQHRDEHRTVTAAMLKMRGQETIRVDSLDQILTLLPAGMCFLAGQVIFMSLGPLLCEMGIRIVTPLRRVVV